MNIEVVSENAYARKVKITVPADSVRAALDKAYKDVMRRAKLPGFREGKVPRKVIEARFGPGIANDVAGDLIQSAWTKTLDEHGIDPVSRPSVTEQSEVKSGQDFTFSIGVEVKPEVEAKVIDKLEVYWPEWEITADEVQASLDARRQGASRLASVEGRPVQAGDTVQVEITVKDGDTVVVSEPGTLVRTVGESWLTGVESLLEGLSIGDDASGDVAFSADARNEDVAGKTLATTVKVLAIQALTAPELDDALAEELGYDNLADMTDKVKAELAGGREEGARNQARANLLEKLIAANPFDVPQGMIEANLRMLMDELKLQQAYQGVDPRNVRFTEAQVADLRIRAVFAAKGGLLLESVASQGKLEVTDADIDAKLTELAESRGQTLEAVKGWFQKDDGMEDLRQRLLEEKTLDFLLDKAVITHEAPEVVEGSDQPDAVEAKPAKKAAAKKPAAKKAAAEEAPQAEEAPKAAAKGGSAYKTIDGVKYAKDLLELAGDAGGKLSLARIKEIVAAAEDGPGITEVEKRTLAYIGENYALAASTQKWLDGKIS